MRTKRNRRPVNALVDTVVLLVTLARYWLTIFPGARRELTHWTERARAIPNPFLRQIASHTLTTEGLNAEGAALFATLAPLRHRPAATRLLVRFQVMYDYLDALTEQPVPDSLRTSRQLHRALLAAFGMPTPVEGYYAHHPRGDDGGYLDDLVEGCRAALAELPGAQHAARYAIRAAARSAEGQSQSHAAVFCGERELMRWAKHATPPTLGLAWWETAAAAESSLVIHALLACAADPQLTDKTAARISAAYWPWITGLNALLDDLIDGAEDAAAGTHSYTTHYTSPAGLARRLGAIAGRASTAIRPLPRRRTHAIILAAMTSFYLASPHAALGAIEPTARSVQEGIDTDLRLLLAMLRARRHLAHSRGTGRGSDHHPSALN